MPLLVVRVFVRLSHRTLLNTADPVEVAGAIPRSATLILTHPVQRKYANARLSHEPALFALLSLVYYDSPHMHARTKVELPPVVCSAPNAHTRIYIQLAAAPK